MLTNLFEEFNAPITTVLLNGKQTDEADKSHVKWQVFWGNLSLTARGNADN